MVARTIPFVVIAALALSACAGSSRDSMKKLKDSVDAYNTAFRWKNFHQAAMYLPNDLRTPFLTYFDEESPSLHIDGIEVLKVDVKSEDAAEVTVRYRYMQLPSVVVDRKVVTQSWHRVDGNWILEDEDPPLVDYMSSPKSRSKAEPTEDGWSTPDSWDADADAPLEDAPASGPR
jgi:hypothetical protein